MAVEKSTDVPRCDLKCLDCSYPKCLYDYEEEAKKWTRQPYSKTGSQRIAPGVPQFQLFPTKYGYEYFVIKQPTFI